MSYIVPGTIVSVSEGVIEHFGVVTVVPMWGEPLVISSSGKVGRVVEQPLSEFAGGQEVRAYGYPGQLSVFEVVSRARSQVGREYSVLTWNCEHFVRWVHGLKPESPQLLRAALIGASLLGIYLLARRN